MLAHVDTRSSLQIAAWTAILVGFFLFLRRSNLVPMSGKSYDKSKLLLRKDITSTDMDVLVNIKWTKMLQHHERCFWLSFQQLFICPVFWLRQHLQKTAIAPGAPLFSYTKTKSRRVVVPLTYRQLAHFLKKWTQQCQFAGKFTLHSLRRIGATWALHQGLAPELIKKWVTGNQMPI